MTNDARANTRIVGSLRSADGKGAVRMEDRYDTDIDDLWSALTDPYRLARWIAEVQGDLRLGGEFQARFTSGWDGPGRVEVCEPPRRLLLAMNPGQQDETVIEALLAAEGDRTRLVIEERHLPLDELAAHGAGWQAHVEDLAAHVAGSEPGDWRSRWTELTPSYQDLAADLT
ncbi:SRPBCC family protein [Streptomyces sp. H10-C2]|uniref:SRPBCC family protein n=1 Tax=unclassified Streptomyces TaxID=2593676 RepID=UPI0024BA9C9E|nr:MULTISPECIES: SRPBCC family protein [unclassified Streptomyces]MDJ0347115.1 SRPBCC family protein [Streptomyces sp. PH10-H1]MDJ0375336.1 SRPBCC family protein [Streptomyces sp. H10-C2]